MGALCDCKVYTIHSTRHKFETVHNSNYPYVYLLLCSSLYNDIAFSVHEWVCIMSHFIKTIPNHTIT